MRDEKCRGCVLIVEDDAVNRKLFATLLQAAGYKTVEAWNGEEGVKLAKENLPDLILMDIQMPLMDGIEAVRILKGLESTATIPVIALTAYALQDDRERFIKEGFDEYIAKPINVKEFLEMVGIYVHS